MRCLPPPYAHARAFGSTQGWDRGVYIGHTQRAKEPWEPNFADPAFWCAPPGRGVAAPSTCPYGQFNTRALGGAADDAVMHIPPRCHVWLDCQTIQRDVLLQEATDLENGGVKHIKKASWNMPMPMQVGSASTTVHMTVIVSMPHGPYVNPDFRHGIGMLKKLSGRSRVVPLVGACEHEQGEVLLVTPYYRHGSAKNWNRLMSDTLALQGRNPLLLRLQACFDLLEAFTQLHVPESHIMCDVREGPGKLLSQFLVDEEFRLVLNDLDATPHVDRHATPPKLAKCGHQQFGANEFVAPVSLCWSVSLVLVTHHCMHDTVVQCIHVEALTATAVGHVTSCGTYCTRPNVTARAAIQRLLIALALATSSWTCMHTPVPPCRVAACAAAESTHAWR